MVLGWPPPWWGPWALSPAAAGGPSATEVPGQVQAAAASPRSGTWCVRAEPGPLVGWGDDSLASFPHEHASHWGQAGPWAPPAGWGLQPDWVLCSWTRVATPGICPGVPPHCHQQVCILLLQLPQGWAEAVPDLLQHKGEQAGTGTPCPQSLAVQHSPLAPAVPTLCAPQVQGCPQASGILFCWVPEQPQHLRRERGAQQPRAPQVWVGSPTPPPYPSRQDRAIPSVFTVPPEPPARAQASAHSVGSRTSTLHRRAPRAPARCWQLRGHIRQAQPLRGTPAQGPGSVPAQRWLAEEGSPRPARGPRSGC